jgi:hypothetical protein
MCTVTWTTLEGGFHLLSNRDELRTRPAALPPRVIERDGVRFIAPIDPQGGGTWAGVNDAGLALCLLNRYDVPFDMQRSYASRGQLVLSSLTCSTREHAVAAVERADLNSYPPFVLLALDPHGPAALLAWDGRHVTIDWDATGRCPLVSSGVDPAAVTEHRRQRLLHFTQGRPDPSAETLYALHCDGAGSPNSYTPHMARAEAGTVSFSWITVRPDKVQYRYLPSAPTVESRGRLTLKELPRTA